MVLAFSGVHICVPIYSPVRTDVTSRGVEEGQFVSGRRVRAEKRRAVRDTFAGRRSGGGPGGLRFRSVSRRESDTFPIPATIRFSKNRVASRGGRCRLVLRRVAPSEAGRKRKSERKSDRWPTSALAKMMLHLTGGMAFARLRESTFLPRRIPRFRVKLCVRENCLVTSNRRNALSVDDRRSQWDSERRSRGLIPKEVRRSPSS